MISQEEKQKIVQELNKKFSVELKCPMCGE